MTLADLAPHQTANIHTLPPNKKLTIQLLEQGFAPNTEISLAHKAPWRGPIAFRLHNTKMTIGFEVAQQIIVVLI